MAISKKRAQGMGEVIGKAASAASIKESNALPKEDTVNRQGFKAYSLSDELRLISILNTSDLKGQFYRTENELLVELRDLVERIAAKDPYFVCQCIVYARCLGGGKRDINNYAAVLVAPFLAGQEFAKRFYGSFDKKSKNLEHPTGGCIYRIDDMISIKEMQNVVSNCVLSNAMKKGFAKVLETSDGYTLAKYKKTVIDIANLVHPNSAKSTATVNINGETVKVLDAIMKGMPVAAETWETKQSDAGQKVAEMVKKGEISKDEAKEVLDKAKNENWNELLSSGKLGILAALRNIRNIMNVANSPELIEKLCELLRNSTLIRKSLIMPYQIDIAYTVVTKELSYNRYSRVVAQALEDGYRLSLPNLAEAMPGKTCVMIDCSGSMHNDCIDIKTGRSIGYSACKKAGLIAATIAVSTGADVIQFGSDASMVDFNGTRVQNYDVFNLAGMLAKDNMGGTNIGSAFALIRKKKKIYDRIILLSDNECNSCGWYGNWVSTEYKEYVREVASPYVYCIDLCSYGTTPLKGDKVNYYFGYDYSLFDDISSTEFNPRMHIDKVKKIII